MPGLLTRSGVPGLVDPLSLRLADDRAEGPGHRSAFRCQPEPTQDLAAKVDQVQAELAEVEDVLDDAVRVVTQTAAERATPTAA